VVSSLPSRAASDDGRSGSGSPCPGIGPPSPQQLAAGLPAPEGGAATLTQEVLGVDALLRKNHYCQAPVVVDSYRTLPGSEPEGEVEPGQGGERLELPASQPPLFVGSSFLANNDSRDSDTPLLFPKARPPPLNSPLPGPVTAQAPKVQPALAEPLATPRLDRKVMPKRADALGGLLDLPGVGGGSSFHAPSLVTTPRPAAPVDDRLGPLVADLLAAGPPGPGLGPSSRSSSSLLLAGGGGGPQRLPPLEAGPSIWQRSRLPDLT